MTECIAAEHGDNLAAYKDGCRCPAAREANRQYTVFWRKQHYLRRGAPRYVDATGSKRRIQALARMGWTRDAVGVAAGNRHIAANVLLERRIHIANAQAIAVAYAKLSMRQGPSRIAAERAQKKRWPAPLDWETVDIDDPAVFPPDVSEAPDMVDETAVLRLMSGDLKVNATRAERVEATRLLDAAGMSAKRIAATIGVTTRTVERVRRENKQKVAA